MTYYRNPKTRVIVPRYHLEIHCRKTTRNSAPWIVDDYIKNNGLEDVTELYKWLAEKYLWSEKEEQTAIDIDTAIEWLKYWKEDYEEFYSTFNPYTVNEYQIMDVWNYIIEWEAE
jgi:murein L,D-transpeptidase YafK